MGYKKITNLQINHPIFLFKEVYALEKIDGTSAHITFTKEETWKISNIFSGGLNHAAFLGMLQSKYKLNTEILEKLNIATEGKNSKTITIYGEGYGGKCQRMGDVYGPINFCAFEVLVENEYWLDVERAAKFVETIGLPFVHYQRGPATIEWLNAQRDKPSEQAKRNGMGDNKIGEGIIVRAPLELYDNNGGRLIAKYKRPDFKRETKTARILTEEDIKVLEDAAQIAEEWVVEERLNHVLSAIIAETGVSELTIKDTGKVLETMLNDVIEEAGDEIIWSEAASKAINKRTALLFKKKLELHKGIANPIEGN